MSYSKPKIEKKLNGKSLNHFSQKDIDTLIGLMNKSKKPIIYSGGGVINSGPEASNVLRELVELTGFPITSTLQGLGAYPCLLYTSPSPRDAHESRMPSSA